MTIEELRCALAVEPGDSVLDEEGLPDRCYLLSVCGGLVMISGDTETVRFIHYTVQEYLERALNPQFSSAHTYLATTCITYLSFSTFAIEQFRHKYHRLPIMSSGRHFLLRYASEHWGNHVRECCGQDPAIHPMVRSFLNRKANVLCSIMVGYRGGLVKRGDRLFPWIVSDLHVAAAFGLDWLVEELLQQGASVDARTSHAQTPLHWAAAGGHTDVVKSLLERGANPYVRDQWKWDAIGLAATAGHEPATRLLLQGAFLPDMQSVIRGVAGKGHLGVLRLILESLKDTTKKKKATYVGTALNEASFSGREACIRLLLEEVEVSEMSELQSHLDLALCQSLRIGNSVITQLLLDHGADLTGGLHIAAEQCYIAGVRHLLDRGANIEAVNSEGDRPIHLSIRSLSRPGKLKTMLELLLERGVDVNVYGSKKESPLVTVAKQGRVTLVQQLLDNGADILAKDGKFNRSATEWGVLGGHLHVVQLLLRYQRPAETNEGLLALTRLYREMTLYKDLQSLRASRDEVKSKSETREEDSNDFRTIPTEFINRMLSGINTLRPEDLKRLLLLHYPARNGDEIVFRAFIDMGADVEAWDKEGETALHTAAAWGHTNIMRLLLDHGAMVDPQEEGNPRPTPLSVAISNSDHDSVQLLIEKGPDMDRDSEIHGPPLMKAIFWAYNEKMVRLLLESGADPNMETAFGHGGNALHRAVSREMGGIFINSKIIRLLIAKGANLEAKDHDGRTPLLVAVRKACVDMVTFLLELGADPNSVDVDTIPKSYVKNRDFETVMQLIEDAKQRWIRDTQVKSPSPSINRPDTKRKIPRISD